jgi:hypothetical protein
VIKASDNDFSQIKITDPRLRKRKMEQAKEVITVTKDIQDNTKEKTSLPIVSCSLSNSLHESKKTRLSAFLRLGTKFNEETPSINTSDRDNINALQNVNKIKENKSSKINPYYVEEVDSDDDALSLHPYEVFSYVLFINILILYFLKLL